MSIFHPFEVRGGETQLYVGTFEKIAQRMAYLILNKKKYS